MADYSINAVTRRAVFSGSAGTGPYAFTFEILSQTDLAVYFNAQVLTLTTDYTVTINANGTGSVTIVVGTNVPTTPDADDQIVIVGGRDIERTTDFVTAGDLRAASLNEQLDSQIIMIQQISEESSRGMRAPVFDPALVADGGVVDMTLPAKASRAGKTLAFDSNGNPVVGEDIGNWRGDWAAATSYTVRDLVKDASNYNVYRCNTAHTSSGTTPISSNADSAKWDLVVDAAYAATQAANAAASASAAATSATNSATSASSAASSASSASSSASSASTAQTAAEAAQAAAELALDNFTDTYLGAFASDPTVDNDGNALTTGDLYFNTTSNELKVYNGSAWQVAAVSTAGLLTSANNLSDVASASTALSNLGGLATTGGSVTGDINFGDNDKAIFGAGSDLQIYHDATDSHVVTTNGDLNLQVAGAGTINLGDQFGNTLLKVVDNADVKLYHGTTPSVKLATTSTGVTITGTAVATTDTDATNTGNITLDFGANQNFVLTLTGNVTLDNPTTEQVGQSGFIVFIQDGTGGRTVSLGTDYETAGGAGLTLSSTASATDIVPYVVAASGRILLGAPQLAFA
jgi:hypothetical protein